MRKGGSLNRKEMMKEGASKHQGGIKNTQRLCVYQKNNTWTTTSTTLTSADKNLTILDVD